MENASKALIMAGGILIAILTVSAFYFMFDRMGILVSQTDEDTLETEILTFNKGFESYNKKLMYGIDVISVLNKAIDNNTRYEDIIEEDINKKGKSDYFVNVNITLNTGFSQVTEKYKRASTTDRYQKVAEDERKVLKKDKIYNLSDHQEDLERILITVTDFTDEDGKIYTLNSGDYKIDEARDRMSYTITYYPCAEFKRRTFECTSIEYNESGRVSVISFKEYK